jgi:hypothetical protein
MKGFKTLLFGGLVAVLGLLEGLNVTDFAALIPDQYEPLVLSGIGFAVVLLRLVTNTPVTKK